MRKKTGTSIFLPYPCKVFFKKNTANLMQFFIQKIDNQIFKQKK